MPIHPSAIIEQGAQISSSADIGPYCLIGKQAIIGPGCILSSHVVVENQTELGCNNHLYPFCCVGGILQDKKFNGEPGRLLIGDHNTIRESVTINIGTAGGEMITQIGNYCLLMAGTHIAHDCTLEDSVIMANTSGLAGHVHVASHSIISGHVGIHQFCRIGCHAFIGAGSMVAFDVPPFCMAQGDRATLAGLNVVGLQRAGWGHQCIATVYRAFVRLFYGSHPRATVVEELLQANPSDEVHQLCTFIQQAKRGVSPARERGRQNSQNTTLLNDDIIATA